MRPFRFRASVAILLALFNLVSAGLSIYWYHKTNQARDTAMSSITDAEKKLDDSARKLTAQSKLVQEQSKLAQEQSDRLKELIAKRKALPCKAVAPLPPIIIIPRPRQPKQPSPMRPAHQPQRSS